MNASTRPYILRAIVILAISTFIALAINEGVYFFQREDYDRGPQTVKILIPEGTADKVAQGDELPTLPESMVFVVGDVIEVKNEDVVDHQLGPIWVPPGTTGSLVLEEANKFSYTCSFSPTNYFGLDVRQPTTLATRLTGLMISAPSMAVFLFIYSFLVFPIKPAMKANAAEKEL